MRGVPSPSFRGRAKARTRKSRDSQMAIAHLSSSFHERPKMKVVSTPHLFRFPQENWQLGAGTRGTCDWRNGAGIGGRPMVAAFSSRVSRDMPDQRRNAMGLRRRQQGIELSRCKSLDFLERGRLSASHRRRIDSAHRADRGPGEGMCAEFSRGSNVGQTARLPVGPRTPGGVDKFQRAGDGGRSRGLRRAAAAGRSAPVRYSDSAPSRSSRVRTP